MRGGGGKFLGWGFCSSFLIPTQTDVSISVDPTQECPGTGGIRLGPGVSWSELLNWPLTSRVSNGCSRKMPSGG